MNTTERVKASPYIEWAKTQAAARFNLATSGLIHYPLAELPVTLTDLELSGPSFYGYAPLQQALAEKCGVGPDCVVHATGTSLANHLAMATILEPGDEVIVEHPAYDPLLAVPRYLGATVKRFTRRREDGFRVDLTELERVVTPRTRLIVLTNMHNPTGALTGVETLRQLGELARSVGARVLVDEVYLEAIFDEVRPYAFQLGAEFVTTSSLTKAYGLSGLRCGWILAEPELARRIWRLHDIFGGIPAHAAERLSVVALRHLDRIAARAQAMLDANWKVLDQFLDSRGDLDTFRPRFGTVASPRLKNGNVDHLCALLREKYDTSAVPGRFFEMPEHFRIGIGIPGDILRQGLARLGAALDEMAERSSRRTTQ
ncbi:MAG TPA: aminotransferase class I/II-fold pyridoxal phosphate-dependent enzyme [Blastocatellia bacterium]|nr:aminotransferase class I/II-fold pyridoxal phosphate-dependent enzyme [Blastocatellia bacterium]